MVRTHFSLVLLFSFFTFSSFAQGENDWSVRFSTGYAFSMNSSVIGTMSMNSGFVNWSNENITGSFSKGVPISLAACYSYNENVDFGLGFDYLLGSEVVNGESSTQFSNGEWSVQTNFFAINPFIETDIVDITDNLTLESNVGLYYNAGGNIIEYETVTFNSGPTPIVQEKEVETEVSGHLGCNGGLSLEYNFSDKIDFFAGVNGVITRPEYKESVVTKWTDNGVDILGGMTKIQTHTDYVDEVDQDSNTSSNPNNDPNSAQEMLKPNNADFASWRAYFGIQVSF